MIDIVTVVFSEELEILKLQARSLDQYAKNIANIQVIVNQDRDLDISTSWWGQWHDRVNIVSRRQFNKQWSQNGWVSQQVLKLLGAAECKSPWSMILDAKTIVIRPLKEFDKTPAVGKLDIYSVFEPSRQIINHLFDIDLQHQLGPGGVPFVINTNQVQQMIAWIENHTQQDFAQWFQQQGRVTEFMLYSGWIQREFGSFDHLYRTDITDLHPCNLCHSEVEKFDQKFLEMQTADTASIHRQAWHKLTVDQQQQYLNFLHSRGIA